MVGKWRVINAAVWLYQVLLPVYPPVDDFWGAKAQQLFRFGPFDDVARLLGRALIPFILWFLIDWAIRRRSAKRSA